MTSPDFSVEVGFEYTSQGLILDNSVHHYNTSIPINVIISVRGVAPSLPSSKRWSSFTYIVKDGNGNTIQDYSQLVSKYFYSLPLTRHSETFTVTVTNFYLPGTVVHTFTFTTKLPRFIPIMVFEGNSAPCGVYHLVESETPTTGTLNVTVELIEPEPEEPPPFNSYIFSLVNINYPNNQIAYVLNPSVPPSVDFVLELNEQAQNFLLSVENPVLDSRNSCNIGVHTNIPTPIGYSFVATIDENPIECGSITNVAFGTTSVIFAITVDSEFPANVFNVLIMKGEEVVIDVDRIGYVWSFVADLIDESQTYTVTVQRGELNIVCNYTIAVPQSLPIIFSTTSTIDNEEIVCGNIIIHDSDVETVDLKVDISSDIGYFGGFIVTVYDENSTPTILTGTGAERTTTLEITQSQQYSIVVTSPTNEIEQCDFFIIRSQDIPELGISTFIDGTEFLCGSIVLIEPETSTISFNLVITEAHDIPVSDLLVTLYDQNNNPIEITHDEGYSYTASIGVTGEPQSFTLTVIYISLEYVNAECTFQIAPLIVPEFSVSTHLNDEPFLCSDSTHTFEYDIEYVIFSAQFISDLPPEKFAINLYYSDNPMTLIFPTTIEATRKIYELPLTEEYRSHTLIVIHLETQTAKTCTFSLRRDEEPDTPPPSPPPTPAPPQPGFIRRSNTIIDSWSIANSGIYYKFCDLTTTCNRPNCSVTIAGRIQTNEYTELTYRIFANSEEIAAGNLTLIDSEATTQTVTYRLNSRLTDILIYFYNDDDEDPIEICEATIQRWNSRILTPSLC